MAWIEVHQELRSHPKIVRTSARLKKPLAETLGYLVSLWLWACAYARNGDLTNFTSEEISMGCNAPDIKDMKKILIETRWLDEIDSKILIHDWKKHGVRVLEQSKKRMRKSRRDNELPKRTVTLPLRDSDALLSLFLSNHSNLSLLRGDGFATAWKEWTKHRREKRKPLTDSQATKQLEWLGVQVNPIACIEQSIRNGWQGLFELKDAPQSAVKRKRLITCKHCNQEVAEDDYYTQHWQEGVCSGYKIASPETVHKAVEEIGRLTRKMEAEK